MKKVPQRSAFRTASVISRSLFSTIILLAIIWPGVASSSDTVLVAAGSTWKYLDNGTDQGTAWRQSSFNDTLWISGPAQLGYGDGDESTVVSYGPNSSAKYTTTYFRHSFQVPDASLYTSLTLNLLRDDGAVVYLNGTEIHRTNMPGGTITSATWASSALGSPEENTFNSTSLSNTLTNGTNVLAVEIHQANGTSSDISFDLELIASDSVSVTRGPYLQTGTPQSMVVKWRTNIPSDSRVRYGLNPLSLTSFVDDLSFTTEHEITLSGLISDTQYYYSIGTTSTVLAGEDANHFFVTSPSIGTARPTRVWVIGDSGTADANAAAVRNAYLALTGNQYTDLWLMLGDNAYNNGTDSEYQAAVFDMYPSLLQQTPLWPTLGNHDGASANSSTQSGPYYDIFKLPTQGEAGGLASGTEAYYSFDFGNIHFICLESFETDRSTNGAMMTWLQQDINATTKDWIIAFWHHPPYTKGSHNSDTETALIEMRQNALPILEQGGVDLVLGGHSHSYERSFLLDGHYGTSNTLTQNMIQDAGSGREDDTGAYQKSTVGPSPHEGAVYAVAGSSGKTSGGLLNHPAMFVSLNSLGSMVLDIDGARLDAKFIDETGAVQDYFTIQKGGTTPQPPTSLSATAVSGSQINLTWTENSNNEDGFKIERSTDGTNFTEINTTGPNTESYSNLGLLSATTYYYRVRAFNASGNSSYSNTANATTQGTGTAPDAPSNLTAIQVSKSKADLAWADNSDNEDVFEIERSSDGVNFSQIAVVSADVTSYSNAQLKPQDDNYYRVRAVNAFGASAYSNVATPGTGGGTQPPQAPSNLTANAVSSSQIDLSWSDNSNNEDGFKIERSTDGTNFSQIDTVGANVTSYPNSGLTASTTYYYRVRAFNSGGNSSYSNTASDTTSGGGGQTPPAAPGNLNATAVSKHEIQLTWSDNSSDEDGFKIERSLNGGAFAQIAAVGSNVTAYTDSSAKPNKLNTYRIRAYNTGGDSSYSNTASATP